MNTNLVGEDAVGFGQLREMGGETGKGHCLHHAAFRSSSAARLLSASSRKNRIQSAPLLDRETA